ncbi:MAG: DUF3795 domain-containing protein [Candidatus Delongbacteria bacterium]|nr:DUF3795 domain-containing protein [Candidatus Delongbacteria bacterium]
MTGACGIDCDCCPIFNATHDRELAEELASQWCQDGHEDASPDWFHCEGCHAADDEVWSSDCAIRECCINARGLETCAQCAAFPCDTILSFECDGIPHHQAAVERLRQQAERLHGS